MNFNPIRFGTAYPTPHTTTPVVKFGLGETVTLAQDYLVDDPLGKPGSKKVRYPAGTTLTVTTKNSLFDGNPTVLVEEVNGKPSGNFHSVPIPLSELVLEQK